MLLACGPARTVERITEPSYVPLGPRLPVAGSRDTGPHSQTFVEATAEGVGVTGQGRCQAACGAQESPPQLRLTQPRMLTCQGRDTLTWEKSVSYLRKEKWVSAEPGVTATRENESPLWGWEGHLHTSLSI